MYRQVFLFIRLLHFPPATHTHTEYTRAHTQARTHTRGLSRCDNQSRAQVCRQIWKYLSLNLDKRTARERGRKRWLECVRERDSDSRAAARFANKGKGANGRQLVANAYQLIKIIAYFFALALPQGNCRCLAPSLSLGVSVCVFAYLFMCWGFIYCQCYALSPSFIPIWGK